ncbi:N-acetylmuramoyl-L-alanine amidase [Polluticaenibacter yanchengensis]|uniref:N-acetylmuramoyl-L-alanine amidase n=1 Tax=Polluticaenibacter yanchengensis TaxID=3014562 RepID=A0ABT4UK86_9BACT|nr:N-acetylmuramoyl-L-alanine amidase [Chitinophagaceae bacterium LY-5]
MKLINTILLLLLFHLNAGAQNNDTISPQINRYNADSTFFSDSSRHYSIGYHIKKMDTIINALIFESTARQLIIDSSFLNINWIGTTNFSARKPSMVIIHHTAQDSCHKTLRVFTDTLRGVSAHYVICKDGTVYQMLHDYLRAAHAGVSKWGNLTNLNEVSLGIELDNNGFEAFTQAQMQSLLLLLKHLKLKYNVPAANFIGHADVAPARKQDPNVYFDWETLSKNGFGLWQISNPDAKLPVDFSPSMALRIIGYDISNLKAAAQAFRRHYLKQNSNNVNFTNEEKMVLYSLMMQSL